MAEHLISDILKARFVGVLDQSGLHERQLPVDIGDESELIIQFGDDNMLHTFMEMTDLNPTFQKEFQSFEANLKILTQAELYNSLKCKLEEMMTLMSTAVSCVGCRRSVEGIFPLVSEMNYRTLSPLKLHKHQDNSVHEFTLEGDYLQSPKKLFMLLYVCKPNMEYLVNNIPRSRKNKRCNLHCLDSHKVKGVGMWMDFWRSLNSDCRDEIVTINIDAFVEALDSYLQKHRFCQECKGKVERAYKLLLKDVKPDENDQEYNEVAFSGIKVCKADRHLHIDSRDDIVSSLITRAEPELSNSSSRRERHAKTMDVAQEEVLICLGIVLHEKLHKLNQKVKAEEQTWLILVNSCLESLKRHLVLAIEEKRGYTNMDLFLLEHEEETKKKEMKKEMKREKKRKKKQAKKTGSDLNSTGHSPSKDGFGLFADDDDDEEDDDEEEDEEEELPKEAPKTSKGAETRTADSCGAADASHEDEVASEWQVVESNQCKQCNRQQRSRGPGDGASDSSGSSRSITSKGLSCTSSNVLNRHTNNNAQTCKPHNTTSSKKKHSNNSGGCGAADSKSQSPTNLLPCCISSRNAKATLSGHTQRASRCTPVPGSAPSVSKRVSCARLSSLASAASAKPPNTAEAAVSNGVSCSSSPTSSSTTPQSSQSSQSHSCAEANAQAKQQSEARAVGDSPGSQQHRGARGRKNGPSGDSCSRSSCHSSASSARQLPLKGEHSSPGEGASSPQSSLKPGERRSRRCEGVVAEGNKDPDDMDNGEDFLTEQERVFYRNKWEEIKEERERLRNKLRQAWTEKTKAIG